jgi:fucose permease
MFKLAGLYCISPMLIALIVPRISNLSAETVVFYLGVVFVSSWPLINGIALFCAYRHGRYSEE